VSPLDDIVEKTILAPTRRQKRIATEVNLALAPLIAKGTVTREEADAYVARYVLKTRTEQLEAVASFRGGSVDAMLESDAPEWTI
jgi:hypothetical protein